MSYLVFARKYRPQSFEEVIGQEHVAQTLRNALEAGRLAHAYLFCGPRGVGKTTMARLLAKAVNCMTSPGANPCGACDACTGIAAGNDVDVLEFDAASNRKVEDMEPLLDAARYLPQRSPRKIFIVDEAHMLSKHAWNSMLKTLEEPPPHVLFIFATTEPHKVIETVRSRCQNFDFKRITATDIAGKLRRIADAEGARVEDAVLDEIAERATGGMRDAESLLDQLIGAAPADRPVTVDDLVGVLGDTPRERRVELLAHARNGAMGGVLEGAARIVDAGGDPSSLLRDLYGDVHDAAIAAARGAETPFNVEWCLAAAEVIGRHLALADRSRAPRATLDLALLALARLGDVSDLEDLVARLESLGGGAPAPRKPAPPAAPAAPAAERPAPKPTGGGAPDLRGSFQRMKAAAQPRPAAAQPRTGVGKPAVRPQNERPSPSPERGLTSEEFARIRALPQVNAALEAFGGRVENVRRR